MGPVCTCKIHVLCTCSLSVNWNQNRASDEIVFLPLAMAIFPALSKWKPPLNFWQWRKCVWILNNNTRNTIEEQTWDACNFSDHKKKLVSFFIPFLITQTNIFCCVSRHRTIEKSQKDWRPVFSLSVDSAWHDGITSIHGVSRLSRTVKSCCSAMKINSAFSSQKWQRNYCV